MTASPSSRATPRAVWLAETIRLSEERWGPYEDSEIVRRIRHEPHTPESAVIARNTALAAREGLDDVAQRWRDNAMLVALGAGLLSVLTGCGAALAALGDGSRPVNLFWALGGLLGVHALTLMLWALSLAWGSKLGSALGRLLLAAAGRLSRIPALAAAGEKAAAARPPAAALVPRALLGLLQKAGILRWLLGALSHGWWLLALLSAFATLIALLSTRRYGFVWETTLLSPDTFVALTHALGWLPAAAGFAVPDASLVRASDGLQPIAPQAQAIWSSWLLGCVLVYGIVPRLLALIWCGALVRLRRRRFALDPTLRSLALLRDRLLPSSERLGVTQPAPATLDATGGPASAFADSQDAAPEALAAGFAAHLHTPDATVMVGVELSDSIAWPVPNAPAHVIDAGNLDTREQRNALLEQLTRQPPARLLIVCDGEQTPDRGTVGLVAELTRTARQARVWLRGAVNAPRHAQWQERLAAASVASDMLCDSQQAALAWLAEGPEPTPGDSHA